MSNLSQYLFQVIDDIPRYCPVQINIPCFAKLYLEDTTKDKSLYASQLAFIWYYLDAKSPYFNSDDRRKESMLAAFGDDSYAIKPTLQSCMDEYIKRQSTPELRSFEAMALMLDNMLKDINRRNQSSEQVNNYLSDIDNQMRLERDLEMRFQLVEMRDRAISSLNKSNLDIINLVPKISNTIKEMAEMRKVVAQSLQEVDSSSNKDNIANHIIYEIIDFNRGY